MILTRFAIYVVLSFVIGHSMYNFFHNQWLMALLVLPGTFLHELAHYVMSALLNGDPTGFSVLPTFDAHGRMETLGHIYSHDNWYNEAAVGLAPLLLMPGTFAILALTARTLNPIKIVVGLWFASTAWLMSTPSTADLTIGYVQSWLFAIPILLLSTYLTYRVTRALLRV